MKSKSNKIVSTEISEKKEKVNQSTSPEEDISSFPIPEPDTTVISLVKK